MKLKFETVFRSGILIVAALLLWAMWGNAQDTTNPVARVSSANKTEAILKFPAVKQRFDDAGIAFAFPTQTIYLKQDSEWQVSGGTEPGNPRR